MILTTFFLFFLYIMFWGVQTIWLLVVGKFKKKYLYVLLQKIGTGTIIFLLVGALCSFEHNLRNMYELSIGLQTYGKISAAYIDNQNLSAWEMHDKLSNVQRQEIYQKLIDSGFLRHLAGYARSCTDASYTDNTLCTNDIGHGIACIHSSETEASFCNLAAS